eukprot:gene3409-646_t
MALPMCVTGCFPGVVSHRGLRLLCLCLKSAAIQPQLLAQTISAPSTVSKQARHGLPILHWSLLELEGTRVPTERRGHSLVRWENFLVVFGGVSLQFYHDLYVYDLEKREWLDFKDKGHRPSTRCTHKAWTWNKCMYIYGTHGFTIPDGTEMFRMNFESETWEKVAAWGDVPSSRAGHSAVIGNGTSVWIFGGESNNTITNDFYTFDLDTCTWYELQYAVSQRDMQAAMEEVMSKPTTRQNRLHNRRGGGILGSRSSFGLRTQYVPEIAGFGTAKPQYPPPLCYHKAEIYGDTMFVFGGGDSEKNYSTLYSLWLGALRGNLPGLSDNSWPFSPEAEDDSTSGFNAGSFSSPLSNKQSFSRPGTSSGSRQNLASPPSVGSFRNSSRQAGYSSSEQKDHGDIEEIDLDAAVEELHPQGSSANLRNQPRTPADTPQRLTSSAPGPTPVLSQTMSSTKPISTLSPHPVQPTPAKGSKANKASVSVDELYDDMLSFSTPSKGQAMLQSGGSVDRDVCVACHLCATVICMTSNQNYGKPTAAFQPFLKTPSVRQYSSTGSGLQVLQAGMSPGDLKEILDDQRAKVDRQQAVLAGQSGTDVIQSKASLEAMQQQLYLLSEKLNGQVTLQPEQLKLFQQLLQQQAQQLHKLPTGDLDVSAPQPPTPSAANTTATQDIFPRKAPLSASVATPPERKASKKEQKEIAKQLLQKLVQPPGSPQVDAERAAARAELENEAAAGNTTAAKALVKVDSVLQGLMQQQRGQQPAVSQTSASAQAAGLLVGQQPEQPEQPVSAALVTQPTSVLTSSAAPLEKSASSLGKKDAKRAKEIQRLRQLDLIPLNPDGTEVQLTPAQIKQKYQELKHLVFPAH